VHKSVLVPSCVSLCSKGTSTHSFGSRASRCLRLTFGGDFVDSGRKFQKKFEAPIQPPLVAVFGPLSSYPFNSTAKGKTSVKLV